MKASSAFALSAEQESTVDWMAARESGGTGAPFGGILADGVGSGKTFVAAGLMRARPLWPTLIVSPKSLLCQWIDVLHRAGMTDLCAVTSGSVASRSTTSRIVVASQGCFGTGGRPTHAALAERQWGRVFVDEAHCAKSVRSAVHRALKALRAHAKWALTATPVQNSEADLVALGRLIGVASDDARLVRDVFVHVDGGRSARSVGSGSRAALPPLSVRTVRLPLVHELERRAYAEASSRPLLSDEDDDEDEDDASTPGGDEDADDEDRCPLGGSRSGGGSSGGGWERQLRCRQAATHPSIYYASLLAARRRKGDGDGDGDLEALAELARRSPSAKVDFIVSDIRSAQGKAMSRRLACVVFYEWTEEMRAIEAALVLSGAEVICFTGRMTVQEREDAIDTFRRGAASVEADGPGVPCVLLAQVRCASCGLNLQFASRAYLTRPHWNPTVDRQAVGRLHRPGQAHPVEVIRLVAEGTVDEACVSRQRRKIACIRGLFGKAPFFPVSSPSLMSSISMRPARPKLKSE